MQTVTRWKLQLRHLHLPVGESMAYMATCAVFVTHQSQECMGVLTGTTNIVDDVICCNRL